MNGCKAGSIEHEGKRRAATQLESQSKQKFEDKYDDEDEPTRQSLHPPDKLQNDVTHP